jgi:hypothetical protein
MNDTNNKHDDSARIINWQLRTRNINTMNHINGLTLN